MRLKKAQKLALLEWVAEGLESGEINDRAAVFEPPFEVSRAQVDYYRRTRKDDINLIRTNGEHTALNTGLALRAIRVEKLKKLADMIEDDLFNKDLLWTQDVKGVGTGAIAEIVEFEEFNRSEVDAYRGILDDIAKEIGERSQKVEHTGKDGERLVINLSWGDDARDND